jgi:hypothetical protein
MDQILQRQMSKQKFIPGIYNYCDRWCERCTFASRCQNYDSTSKFSPEQLDINNKVFWDTISENFAKAIALIHKAAQEHGIDLNTAWTKEEEEAYAKRKRFLKDATQNDPLIKLCKKYEQTVRPFLQSNYDMVDKSKELVSEFEMGLKTELQVIHAVAGIGDCVEIIQWYLFFIDTKLQRALRCKLDGFEEKHDFPKDSDGSAKIALIAIERSMNAWMNLYELMPSAEDTALKCLAILSQLKQQALQEFPNAMQFKRPGFDE